MDDFQRNQDIENLPILTIEAFTEDEIAEIENRLNDGDDNILEEEAINP
jgi:hypothetical protein